MKKILMSLSTQHLMNNHFSISFVCRVMQACFVSSIML